MTKTKTDGKKTIFPLGPHPLPPHPCGIHLTATDQNTAHDVPHRVLQDEHLQPAEFTTAGAMDSESPR